MTLEIESKDTLDIKANILRPGEAGWSDTIDVLRNRLGAPGNPSLFPPHFIKKTLVSIGGFVVEFKDKNELLGAGFVFPRRTQEGTGFTLRFHGLSSRLSPEKAQSLTERVTFDKNGTRLPVHLYIPSGNIIAEFPQETVSLECLRIGQTSPQEGARVRDLQKEVWGVSDDFLYPADIHTSEFSLPTSLIAYVDGKAVGFLFGFDKFCFNELPEGLSGCIANPTLREESQLMGVLPDQRSRGIASTLKIKQAEKAIQNGTEIINWTFDPLLSQNAVLNLKKLRVVIWEHNLNYYNYAFSGANRLSQIPASRVSVSWLISSPRVREEIAEAGRSDSLKNAFLQGDIPVVNSTHGYNSVDGEEMRAIDDTYTHSLDVPQIAIEIPVNWVDIQEKDIPLAQQWRSITDAIFQEYIGRLRGQYAITDIVTLDKNDSVSRAFLIGKPIDQIQKIFLGEDVE